MPGIAELPQPPYFAVIAPAVLRPDVSGYAQTAQATLRAAQAVVGFHGIEMCAQPGFSIAVSYWRSLDAIDEWRHHARHERAKALGRSRWFSAYATRIAQVVDAY
mgnify:CR=1 FL=1